MSNNCNKYDDLIHAERPWPINIKVAHPPMSRQNRAVQFAPFEALRGHKGDLGHENWKLTRTRRIDLSEDDINHLSDKLLQISKGDEITVVFFVPDDGEIGYYETLTGTVTAVDIVYQSLEMRPDVSVLSDSPVKQKHQIRTIRFNNIIDVSSESIIAFDPYSL